jgi:hypothetical protein
MKPLTRKSAETASRFAGKAALRAGALGLCMSTPFEDACPQAADTRFADH